jgi:enterochelin esterase-like enzyme
LFEAGRIEQTELVDPALPRSLPYRIYLPACYDRPEFRGFPVLYLLHGLSRTDSQWDDLGADEVADGLIAAGDAPPFLMVMPWERLGLDFESAVVDTLVPAVERRYRAHSDRSMRAIAGISRGAGWALRIGVNHPEVFGAVGLHSPAILPPDLYTLPGLLAEAPPNGWPALWIDIGDRDGLRTSAQDLAAMLDKYGVEYSWRAYPGYHTEEYWAAHLQVYLRWHAAQWQAARMGP